MAIFEEGNNEDPYGGPEMATEKAHPPKEWDAAEISSKPQIAFVFYRESILLFAHSHVSWNGKQNKQFLYLLKLIRDPLLAISSTLAGPPTRTVPWTEMATKPENMTMIWNTSVQITAFTPPCWT